MRTVKLLIALLVAIVGIVASASQCLAKEKIDKTGGAGSHQVIPQSNPGSGVMAKKAVESKNAATQKPMTFNSVTLPAIMDGSSDHPNNVGQVIPTDEGDFKVTKKERTADGGYRLTASSAGNKHQLVITGPKNGSWSMSIYQDLDPRTDRWVPYKVNHGAIKDNPDGTTTSIRTEAEKIPGTSSMLAVKVTATTWDKNGEVVKETISVGTTSKVGLFNIYGLRKAAKNVFYSMRVERSESIKLYPIWVPCLFGDCK